MLKYYLTPGLAVLAALPLLAQKSENHYATQNYDSSNVQAQIRLTLENNEKAVHFIRDNTDPYVVTKIYQLKNADPYELRTYLRTMVQSKKISQDNTAVECAKLNDGTGFLLVAAEKDRFGAQPNGMGIDDIVAALDQPKIAASSGSLRFVYFPKFRSAAELQTLVYNVGMTHINDTVELQQGNDLVAYEPGINALLFSVPSFSRKNIETMLKLYDQPLPQANIKYTIYELYDEGDGKLGADFQSWKNNDGIDLLSVGGRYRSNWTSTWAGGIAPQTGSNKTQYFNFNPKWNSKYLDFLVSKGKGQIVTTGEVVVKNNDTAVVNIVTNLFQDEYPPIDDANLTQYVTATGIITSAANENADYYFSATDSGGTSIQIVDGILTGAVAAVKITPPNNSESSRYQVKITNGSLTKGGRNLGTQIDAASFKLYQKVVNWNPAHTVSWISWSEVPFTNDISIQKGRKIETVAGPGYGLKLTLTPKINSDASTLSIDITNTSLIGWTSDGKPRVDKDGQVKSDVMISNDGNRFIIGGIDKRELVRSVAGVPFLRELPVLGWVFAAESESTKRSRLVLVGESRVYGTGGDLDAEKIKVIQDNKEAQKDAGDKNTWGFDQYGLDPDATKSPTDGWLKK
jgi:type II secretory pathway component GspD/PulD (secretin)